MKDLQTPILTDTWVTATWDNYIDNQIAQMIVGYNLGIKQEINKDGHLVNSDLNGSLNIGRKALLKLGGDLPASRLKCKHNGFAGVSRGSLTAPRRINLLKLERNVEQRGFNPLRNILLESPAL